MTMPGQKPPKLNRILKDALFFVIAAVVVYLWFHALFGAA